MLKSKEPIAIVGIGCHTPGKVYGPNDLWKMLCAGINGITTVPSERWNIDEYYDPNPDKPGKIKTNRGGFIEGMKLFDNEFFNIFPKEAVDIDPQQRLLLQCTFEALEDAGEKLENCQGSQTAVYVGYFESDYQDILADPSSRYSVTSHMTMGTHPTSLANRISYLYNLKGPSITLNTACSSSLIAVHLACQSIWNQEAYAAIAGGINININPLPTMALSKGNFLSPDGACKSFDESGNGYVRGEGVGLVYLKPLSQALTDQNKIYGLICGSACNSDGYTAEGFTVPSADAQATMLQAAYHNADIDVANVQFIEAHGTGTPKGDLAETEAFAKVFSHRPIEHPLLIGSIKSNFGHLEGAAGIVGLIKLALCLHHKKIPGNLHFKKGNPNIDWDNWRLKVVDQTQDWPPQNDDSVPRTGGVNSFGAGGTNAHLVMKEYIPEVHHNTKKLKSYNIQPSTQRVELFTCSAQTEKALKALLGSYQKYLSTSEANLNDICFNAGKHRSVLNHRIAIAATNKQDCINKINAFLEGDILSGVEYFPSSRKTPRLGFIFTGQGPQWYAMGRELIAKEPLFREVIEEIDLLFSILAGWSLLEEMNRSKVESKISDTRIAQPAIMAIQIALVELWKQYGIEPAGLVGHSIGEVAAAYASGALNMEQAVTVIYHRSRGQHQAAGKGVMLAIGVSKVEAEKLIADVSDVVSIAAVNGPESITLSGDKIPLDAIAKQLTARDIFNRFLKVDVPFHSHHMDPLKEELISSLQDLQPIETKIPLYSTVTGKQESGTHLDANYWYNNLRDPVYFSHALEQMIQDGFDLYVEVGPHPALSNGAEELFAKLGCSARIFPSIRRQEDEALRFKQTLGALHVAGLPLDWDKICPNTHRLHDLPRYPWQQQRFWRESRAHREHRLQRRLHPHITQHWDSGLSQDLNLHTIDIFLDHHADPYINDHRVDNIIIYPATGHLELVTASAHQAFNDSFCFLEDINFDKALFLPDEGEALKIRVEVYSDEGRYCLMSYDDNQEGAEWIKHSNGKINCMGNKPKPEKLLLSELQARINNEFSVQPMYHDLKQSGLFYGTTFRAVSNLWTAPGELLSKISLHESLKYGINDFLLHPSMLDACFHTIFAVRPSVLDGEQGVYLPVHIDRYTFIQQPKSDLLWSYIRISEASADFIRGDIFVLDENGETVAEITNLQLKYIVGSRKQEENTAYSGCYEYCWQPAEDLSFQPESKVKILLIGDASYDHSTLLNTLSDANIEVVKLEEATGFEQKTDLQDRQATRKAIQEIKSIHPSLNRILITLPLGQSDETDLSQRMETLVWKTLNINNALIENEMSAVMWTLNQHSEQVVPKDEHINLIQSSTCALSRVMTNEYPMVVAKIVDLGCGDKQELQSFVTILASTTQGGNETEWAIRGDKLFVKRLEKVIPEEAQKAASKTLTESNLSATNRAYYEAFFAEPSVLNSVAFRQFMPPILGEEQIEIEVKAAALNFKDVLNGRGVLSAESVAGGLCGDQLGLESSGVVTRVGKSVKNYKIGDAVLAMAPRSIAGMTVAPQQAVFHKPQNLSFEEAATIPIVYLTAYYGLHELACMNEKDRLLIHAGSGGLGIAAINLARHLGITEIFVTAGSEEKRRFLEKEMGIETSRIYDSRTLDFYQQIMAATNNEGIDVVLNSLSGKAITQSLKCLRPFGRFIEVGKKDIYRDAALYLKRFGENISYFAVDTDRLMAQKPALGNKLLTEVIDLFKGENPSLKPHPITVFHIDKLNSALDYLSKSQHIGKVVLSMENREPMPLLPATNLILNPQKVYIITGGASGLGIQLAQWLVDKGARKLVLASRSGAKTEEDRALIAAMEKRKVEIKQHQVDLIHSVEVAHLITEAKKLGNIGGIIHAAAFMKNATIQNLYRATFSEVFAAKAMGAWNLHQHLKNETVDFFLLISSIAAVFGFGGQSNYAVANNFLDKLVYYRHLQKMPAHSVNLGVLGQFAGMSSDAAFVDTLANQGLLPMTFQQVTAKIERILLDEKTIPVRMAANINWLRFRDFFTSLSTDLRFAHLLTDEALNLKGKASSGGSLRDTLKDKDADQAKQELVQYLTGSLAKIVGTTPDKIDPNIPLTALGLDSITMTQKRHNIQRDLNINYPLMRFVKGPSIIELASQLHQELVKTEEPVHETGDSSGITTEEDIEVINRWFVRLKRKAGEPPKKTKLFMIHSMGAAASMFAHFMYHPPFECEVYAVQLPGREHRINEEVYTELTPLLSSLEEALIPLLEGDFAIYGHSYGGIIAFELCRLLREKYGKFPLQLFISATIAPQLTPDWKARQVMRETTNRNYSDQQLIDMMPHIMNREYLLTILEGMRRDMPLLKNYDYQECEPFSFPIRTFSAIEDDVTFTHEMKPWALLTLFPKDQIELHGDHWSLTGKENKELVGKQISDDLRNLK